MYVCYCSAVEYTPQAYLSSDLQLFAETFSADLLGKEPNLVSIDGGKDLLPDRGTHRRLYSYLIRRLCTDYIPEL